VRGGCRHGERCSGKATLIGAADEQRRLRPTYRHDEAIAWRQVAQRALPHGRAAGGERRGTADEHRDGTLEREALPAGDERQDVGQGRQAEARREVRCGGILRAPRGGAEHKPRLDGVDEPIAIVIGQESARHKKRIERKQPDSLGHDAPP